MIVVFIKGQELKLSQPTVVANTVDYLEMKVVFQTSDWSGLSKWAHFKKKNTETVFDVLLTDNMIRAQDHLSLDEGEWEVYFHGNGLDETPRITTNVKVLQVQATGFVCVPLPDIPLSAAEQIAAQSQQAYDTANEALEEVQKVKPYADAAKESADKAAVSEQNAKTSETNAKKSEKNAKTSETNANASAGVATQAKTDAVAAKNAAEAAQIAAETAKSDAVTAKDTAVTAKNDAVSAKNDAVSAKNDAVTAKKKAEAAKDAAALSESNASTSERNASTSASNASTSESNASTSESNASASESNAKTSENNAATSASNASTSEGNAAQSALDAKSQADRAKEQADAAADSAQTITSLGISSASVGDLAIVKAVNELGVPTEWKPTTLEELEGKWELIEEFVSNGAVIRKTEEPDGTPYNFKAVAMKIFNENSESKFPNWGIFSGAKKLVNWGIRCFPGKSMFESTIRRNGFWETYGTQEASNDELSVIPNATGNAYIYIFSASAEQYPTITAIQSVAVKAGVHYQLYAIRG